jgi:DNA-binding CsgD family transcriptional regulator
MYLAANQTTRGNHQSDAHAQAEPEFDAGLLLLDLANRPVYASPEAMRILLYPHKPGKIQSLASDLAKKIKSVCLENGPTQRPLYARELVSGKRRYFCRIFDLASGWKNSRALGAVVLLERAYQISPLVSSITKHFQLTCREEETVRLLLAGLTSKEIAQRMRISPNTVKAFLRLVMIKMGVSNRPGIIGKIFQAPVVSIAKL